MESRRHKLIDSDSIYSWLIQLMKSKVGYAILLIVSLGISFIISKLDVKLGVILTIAPIGAILMVISFFNPKFAIYLVFTLSYFIFYFKRLISESIPFGAIVETIVFVSILGIFFTRYRHKKGSWSDLNHPFTYFLIAFLLYFIIQAFNPNMHRMDGWIFGFRKLVVHILIYFIVIFAYDTKKFFKDFIKLWLFLSFLTGLYGCYQEWVDFSASEWAYIYSSELAFNIIFIDGHFRKFSFFSDPTAFGVLMALTGTFSLIQLTGPYSVKKKMILFVFVVFMFLGMVYSGTRTAFAIVPACLILFFLMTINNKKTLIGSLLVGAVFAFIIFGPIHGNGSINRIRSTFEFSDDPSMNVRDVNRAYIQPYILKHPIGGGIMTSGATGAVYNPDHELAGFPPDSSYLRVAMESGYIGLIFICLFYFTILKVSISNFYRAENDNIKYYYLGFAAIFYAIVVAEYAQEVAGQMPCSIIFYSFLAIMVKLKKVGV